MVASVIGPTRPMSGCGMWDSLSTAVTILIDPSTVGLSLHYWLVHKRSYASACPISANQNEPSLDHNPGAIKVLTKIHMNTKLGSFSRLW